MSVYADDFPITNNQWYGLQARLDKARAALKQIGAMRISPGGLKHEANELACKAFADTCEHRVLPGTNPSQCAECGTVLIQTRGSK